MVTPVPISLVECGPPHENRDPWVRVTVRRKRCGWMLLMTDRAIVGLGVQGSNCCGRRAWQIVTGMTTNSVTITLY